MGTSKIAICGGDVRSLYMGKLFKNKGYDVCVCLTDKAEGEKHGLEFVRPETALKCADVVIMGLPAVNSQMTVNAPMCADKMNYGELLHSLKDGCILCGGRFSAQAVLDAADCGFEVFDYSADEVFQIENAFYTAEGAIEAIIKNTVRSLGELSVFVTGFGRISRALTEFLSAMGSSVTVYARKAEQRAWAKRVPCNVTDEISDLSAYDVIVNTVPFCLLGADKLQTVGKDALIVDLSARPGYVSSEGCKRLGINLAFLPGLPSVSAPCSAGEAAGRAVMRRIKGDGV